MSTQPRTPPSLSRNNGIVQFQHDSFQEGPKVYRDYLQKNCPEILAYAQPANIKQTGRGPHNRGFISSETTHVIEFTGPLSFTDVQFYHFYRWIEHDEPKFLKSITPEVLLQLYKLADELDFKPLRIATESAFTSLMEYCYDWEHGTTPSFGVINYVYEHLRVDSPMRRRVLFLFAYRYQHHLHYERSDREQKLFSQIPAAFWVDYMQLICQIRGTVGTGWGSSAIPRDISKQTGMVVEDLHNSAWGGPAESFYNDDSAGTSDTAIGDNSDEAGTQNEF